MIFHEAGHTAMFAHYEIPIQSVSIRPDLAQGYGGMVRPAIEEPGAGKEKLKEWMRCAAAGQAAERRGYGRQPQDDPILIDIFERTINYLAENPNPNFHDDMLNFVRLARTRDKEMAPEQAGPSNWIEVWREAEELIRGELWPAVEAVFKKLLSIAEANNGKPIEEMPDLDGEEAAEIVRTALTRKHKGPVQQGEGEDAS
jgi:hypothetical protein